MNVLRNEPIFKDFYFVWIDMDSYGVDFIPQIFDFVHRKWAFVHVQIESVLSKSVEDLSKLSDMFFPWLTKNQDIV